MRNGTEVGVELYNIKKSFTGEKSSWGDLDFGFLGSGDGGSGDFADEVWTSVRITRLILLIVSFVLLFLVLFIIVFILSRKCCSNKVHSVSD